MLLIIYDVVEFNVQRILDIPGVVAAVAFVANADTIVAGTVNYSRSQKPILVTIGIQRIQLVIPIRLRKFQLNSVDQTDIVKILSIAIRCK